MLLNPNASDSFLGNIFYEIKTLMARFSNCSLQYNHRQSNKTTYSLENLLGMLLIFLCGMGVPPTFYLKLFGLIRDFVKLFEVNAMIYHVSIIIKNVPK